MAQQEPTKPVVRSPEALDDLHAIWQWNAQRYGGAHADEYLEFLDGSIDELAARFADGRVVGVDPNFRYTVMQRRAKAHGHVAVYRVEEHRIRLLHVFHTSQDWQTKLSSKREE